jgi:hypothetical protein
METGEVLLAPGKIKIKILGGDRSYNCGHRKGSEGKQDGGVVRSSEEVW